MIRSKTTFGDATRSAMGRRVVKIDRQYLPDTTPIIEDLQHGGSYPAVVAIRSTVQGANVKDGCGLVSWTITFGPVNTQIQGMLLKNDAVRGQFSRVNERISSVVPLRKDAFWEVWFGIPMLLPGNEFDVPDLWGATCYCPSVTKEEQARQMASRQKQQDERWWYSWLPPAWLPSSWTTPLPEVAECVNLWEPTAERDFIQKTLRSYGTAPMMSIYEAWVGDRHVSAQLIEQGVPIKEKDRTRYQEDRRIENLLARFPPGEAHTLCVGNSD